MFYDFLTSLIRIFFIGRVIWYGALSSFWMVSFSITDSWDGNGWKTDARCFAKAVSFCWSVRAQVLRFMRVGGIWCWGFFSLRVISITNSPWLQLASGLGDSFGYPRFWGFVTGVLILSRVCCNIVYLEGLLLVAIFCELFVCMPVSVLWLSEILLYGFGRYYLGLPAMLHSVLLWLCFRLLLQCRFQFLGVSSGLIVRREFLQNNSSQFFCCIMTVSLVFPVHG